MKTLMMTSAVLIPLLVGCGGNTSSNGRAVQTSCSLTLRANATAAEVQTAVNAVLEGKIDPCGGAVTNLNSRMIELERIEDAFDTDNQRFLTLVFRVSGQEMGPYSPK
jgi:hypothetical protein